MILVEKLIWILLEVGTNTRIAVHAGYLEISGNHDMKWRNEMGKKKQLKKPVMLSELP